MSSVGLFIPDEGRSASTLLLPVLDDFRKVVALKRTFDDVSGLVLSQILFQWSYHASWVEKSVCVDLTWVGRLVRYVDLGWFNASFWFVLSSIVFVLKLPKRDCIVRNCVNFWSCKSNGEANRGLVFYEFD